MSYFGCLEAQRCAYTLKGLSPLLCGASSTLKRSVRVLECVEIPFGARPRPPGHTCTLQSTQVPSRAHPHTQGHVLRPAVRACALKGSCLSLQGMPAPSKARTHPPGLAHTLQGSPTNSRARPHTQGHGRLPPGHGHLPLGHGRAL